jgi:hypothetical protein
MRCLMCDAEMRLLDAKPDAAATVLGFERRTYECSDCREIESRLVFSSEPTQLSRPDHEPLPEPSPPAGDGERPLVTPWQRAVARFDAKKAALDEQAADEIQMARLRHFNRAWQSLVPLNSTRVRSKSNRVMRAARETRQPTPIRLDEAVVLLLSRRTSNNSAEGQNFDQWWEKH